MGPLFPYTYLVCRYYIWSSLPPFLPSFLFLTSFLPFSPDLPVLPRSPASFPISPCSARIPPFGCILLRISHPTAPLPAAIPGCVATAAARPHSPHAPEADPAATAHARRRLRSNAASPRSDVITLRPEEPAGRQRGGAAPGLRAPPQLLRVGVRGGRRGGESSPTPPLTSSLPRSPF